MAKIQLYDANNQPIKRNISLSYPDGKPVPGSIINPVSGQGGDLDRTVKSSFGTISPYLWRNNQYMENIYIQSWAARKFINLPVDDIKVRWRSFFDLEKEAIKLFQKNERKHKIKTKFGKALKTARLHGYSFVVLITKEAPADVPLNHDAIQPGDLTNLIMFPPWRHSLKGDEFDYNPYSEYYEETEFYTFLTRTSEAFTVHSSRVLCFKGFEPPAANHWESYGKYYGISELLPIISVILQMVGNFQGVSNTLTENDLKVMKLKHFNQIYSDPENIGEGDISPKQMAKALSEGRSNLRTLMMDVDSEFERIAASFGGIPQLLDKFFTLLSAAVCIPATRFLGKSPDGQNSTGQSDTDNYELSLLSIAEDKLEDPLDVTDIVVARDAGLSVPPEYRWLPLKTVSETERATATKTRAETAKLMIESGLADEPAAMKVIGDIE